MTDESALKLHVAPDGLVWMTAGRQAPRSTNCDTNTFLRQPQSMEDCPIRVLGLPRNAPLIAGLYAQRAALGFKRIELAGPQVCDRVEELSNPEVALFRMRQCLLPSHCGGWHILTDRDYPAYAHAAEPDGRWLESHPAWPSLSFIGGVNREALATLLSQLLDPRWHVSPDKPERSGRLRNFLGLMPRSAAKAAGRYALVRDAWKTQLPEGAIERPEYFLWRVFLDAGELSACHKFAAFLRHTWIDSLHRGKGADDLFDPRLFFARPDVSAAYLQHMRGFSAGV